MCPLRTWNCVGSGLSVDGNTFTNGELTFARAPDSSTCTRSFIVSSCRCKSSLGKWSKEWTWAKFCEFNESWLAWFFDEAVEDWDAAPSLFLTTSQDGLLSCNHLRGKTRVCNDEFGDTGWFGLNEAIYYEYGDGKENTIVSSVAKINESYLREASDSQKQYVVRLGTH